MDRYIFIHVPKTAGTSLISLFRQVLGAGEVSPTIGGHFDSVNIEQYDRYRMVVGHLRYDHLAQFPKRRALTFLREPVDVIVSKYYHYRNLPPGVAEYSEPYACLCREMSLAQLADQAERLKWFFNDAVWRFTGLGRYAPFIADENPVALACTRLAACDFVGLYEEFADSVDLMSYTFGWPHVNAIPRENVSSGRKHLREIDAVTVRKIADANRLDADLYQFARELYQTRKREVWKRILSAGAMPPAGPTRAVPAVRIGHAGTGQARILAIQAANADRPLRSGDVCEVKIVVLASQPVDGADVVIRVLNTYEQVIYAAAAGAPSRLEPSEFHEFVFRVPMNVAPGQYIFEADVISGQIGMHEVLDHAAPGCTVDISGYGARPFRGVADLHAQVRSRIDPTFASEYRAGDRLDFTRTGNAGPYRLAGWATPEDWACWTNGEEAQLVLRLQGIHDQELEFVADVQPFCPERELNVNVVANGTHVAAWRFSPPGQQQQMRVLIAPEVIGTGILHLQFQIEKPTSPAQLNLSDDHRLLGIAFRTLELREAPRSGSMGQA